MRLRATVQLSMLKHVSVSETKISLFEGVDSEKIKSCLNDMKVVSLVVCRVSCVVCGEEKLR